MIGTLGYLRGAARCLLCNREHEPTSVSFGVYGSASICPGHPIKRNRGSLTPDKFRGNVPGVIADEIIGRPQGR
jgi:hypothetical protein